jgi:hypothetical protein
MFGPRTQVHQYGPNPVHGLAYNPYEHFPQYVPQDAHMLPNPDGGMYPVAADLDPVTGAYQPAPINGGGVTTNPEEIAEIKGRLLSY